MLPLLNLWAKWNEILSTNHEILQTLLEKVKLKQKYVMPNAKLWISTERTEILGRFSSPLKIKTLESGVSKYREWRRKSSYMTYLIAIKIWVTFLYTLSVSNREYHRRRLNFSTDFCTHKFSKNKAKANKKYKIWRNLEKIEAGLGSTSRLIHEVCLTGLTNQIEVIELNSKQFSD